MAMRVRSTSARRDAGLGALLAVAGQTSGDVGIVVGASSTGDVVCLQVRGVM